MHPILSDRRRLALYIAGWLPIGVLLTAGLAERAAWPVAFAVMLPLAVVFAFVGLSAWYVCRAFPIDDTTGLWRAMAVHSAAAATASASWVAMGGAWAAALDSLWDGLGAERLYSERRSLLFVIGALLFVLAVVFHYLLMAFEASRAAERRALELSLLARDAELRALRAQVDPHFLFNSLHSISALTAEDPAAARHMCLLLADFLRETVRVGARTRISLADELALADRFLEIEGVRLGPRLRVVRDVPADAAACLVPPLLLQPLVENAVMHGIGELLGGGTIRIDARRSPSTLTMTLENPCDPDRPRRPRSGIGLDLLKQRVVRQFGADGAVHVEERDGRFRVEVRIPAVTAA